MADEVIFDGTGDYMEWKGKVMLLQLGWAMDGLTPTKQIRNVLLMLSGAPFFTATNGGDIDSVIRVDPDGGHTILRDIPGIFKALEEQHGGLITKEQAAADLSKLKQGKMTLADYMAEFDKLSAIAGTPATQKPITFYKGLSRGIKNEFAEDFMPESHTLANVRKAACRADKKVSREERRKDLDTWSETRKGQGGARGWSAKTTQSGDGTSDGEDKRKCFYCDKPGHLKADCNTRKRGEKNGGTVPIGKAAKGGGTMKGFAVIRSGGIRTVPATY
ncbi:hypothetical protein B0I37DRAFT_350725 [Chaetomium sp. MPI-CAGE-AT-0009]|nr:hypothetical protein B0I37DRAFT_350725 [Chaetomium sp. MPI-CAGE-AT-0009]